MAIKRTGQDTTMSPQISEEGMVYIGTRGNKRYFRDSNGKLYIKRGRLFLKVPSHLFNKRASDPIRDRLEKGEVNIINKQGDKATLNLKNEINKQRSLIEKLEKKTKEGESNNKEYKAQLQEQKIIINQLQKQLHKIEKENNKFKKVLSKKYGFNEYAIIDKDELNNIFELTMESFSTDFYTERGCEYVPVTIYWSGDPKKHQEYINLLERETSECLAHFGLEEVIPLPPEISSWFGKKIFKKVGSELKNAAKDHITEGDINEFGEGAKRRISQETWEKIQAEINEKYSKAFKNIVEGCPEGHLCILAGSNLIVRLKNEQGEYCTVSFPLSAQQYKFIQGNPILLTQPQEILNELSNEINFLPEKANIKVIPMTQSGSPQILTKQKPTKMLEI